jgi:hypothetical protein
MVDWGAIRQIADWGTVPHWVTAIVAAGALFAAIISIKSQREIARKRAAMDFFVKTEMDRDTLEAYKDFASAVDRLNSSLKNGSDLTEFAATESYWKLRDYLNLHELMAVGILNDVLDDDVCYYFWSGKMERSYRNTLPVICYVQSLPGQCDTYVELVKIAKRWMRRDGLPEADIPC